jgi:hypothetical protein
MAATRKASKTVSGGWLGEQVESRCSKAAWPQLGETGFASAGRPAAASPTAGISLFGGSLAFDEADLARACAQVALDVRLAEREAAAAGHEARIAAALEAIARSLDAADAVLDERRLQFREAAGVLAALATKALRLPSGAELAERLADGLASDCLARFDSELDIVVEAAPEIADALAARVASSAVVERRAGRVTVEAVAAIEPGAVRLVWPQGSAEWSIQRIQETAAALVRRLTDDDRPPSEPSVPRQSSPEQPPLEDASHPRDRLESMEGEEA